MRRYLVVANQTLLGGPLMARVQECLAAGLVVARVAA
jgi:hypothetical protein